MEDKLLKMFFEKDRWEYAIAKGVGKVQCRFTVLPGIYWDIPSLPGKLHRHLINQLKPCDKDDERTRNGGAYRQRRLQGGTFKRHASLTRLTQ